LTPGDREEDGILGESSGYYMAFGKSPTIHVTGFRYRKDALYHAVVPWAREVDSLLYLVHGLDFIPKMKREIPSLHQIHLVPMTFGSHVVMSIDTDTREKYAGRSCAGSLLYRRQEGGHGRRGRGSAG
jgi:UbiD family decarboxylase